MKDYLKKQDKLDKLIIAYILAFGIGIIAYLFIIITVLVLTNINLGNEPIGVIIYATTTLSSGILSYNFMTLKDNTK